MNTLLNSKKRIFSFIIILLLLASIPIAVFLSQQQQNLEQNAATGADLVVESFQLTDAGGNVKSTFAVNEDIYVLITLKNQGGATATSQDGSTYTEIYGNKSLPVSANTTSDINIGMKNGEFHTGSALSYSSIYTSDSRTRFYKAKAWKQSSPGTYKAVAYINYNKFATETNYDNNQKEFSYSVTTNGGAVLGKATSSIPDGYTTLRCVADENNVEPNLEACVTEGSANGKTFARVRNKSATTTYKVGLASYQAYRPYPTPYPTCSETSCPEQYDWIWTQTYYSSVTYDLAPGRTIFLSVDAPACAWQSDVFTGSVIPSFSLPDNWYSGKKTYLDGFYETKLSLCQPVIPSPTPEIPTASPTPTTVTPSPTISVPPEESPTPSPSVCPIPAQVTNVRVICPYCKEDQP